MWTAFERQARFLAEFARDFRSSLAPVLIVSVTAVAAGVLFGLALVLPATKPYRWERAVVVGVIPFILVVVFVLIFSQNFGWLPVGLILTLDRTGSAGLVLSGVLFGASLSSGFGPSNRPVTRQVPRAPL